MPDDEAVAGGTRELQERRIEATGSTAWRRKGWTAPTWPKQYGGGGLSGAEARVLDEEMQALGCRPPLSGMGLSMLGPTLLEYGTEEQKQTHLPHDRHAARSAGARATPSRGRAPTSPACRPRAVLQGEHFLVNGQKIWTSYADYADWIFCLVRTDPTAKKHEGISFLLIDMATPACGRGRSG